MPHRLQEIEVVRDDNGVSLRKCETATLSAEDIADLLVAREQKDGYPTAKRRAEPLCQPVELCVAMLRQSGHVLMRVEPWRVVQDDTVIAGSLETSDLSYQTP
jgi:hypothetical protein